MYLNLPTIGLYVPIDDKMNIQEHEEDAYVLYVSDFEVVLTKEQRDMFVVLHEEALDMDANVLHYDLDKPQFKMRLSGRDDLPTDVGIE